MKRKKRNKKGIILFVILIIVLLAIFVLPKYKNKMTKEPEKVAQVKDVRLIIPDSYETRIMNEKDSYSTFDVKYPYFKNANEEFNLKVKSLLEQQIKDQKTYAKEGWQARYSTQAKGDNIPEFPKEDDKWPFYSEFTIVQSNDSYISYVLLYGGFTGGAHGYESRISFNYDLKNNKELTLKDIFSKNLDYLKYISDESRKELTKQFATLSEEDKANSSPDAIDDYVNNMMSMINDGTTPKEENFSVFTFTPDKIKIYFAQYQVGPYVIGMPEIELDRK